MPQTPEDRMYRLYRRIKRSPAHQHEHYRKGWTPSAVMQVAQRFSVPCRRVKEIIESRRIDA